MMPQQLPVEGFELSCRGAQADMQLTARRLPASPNFLQVACAYGPIVIRVGRDMQPRLFAVTDPARREEVGRLHDACARVPLRASPAYQITLNAGEAVYTHLQLPESILCAPSGHVPPVFALRDVTLSVPCGARMPQITFKGAAPFEAAQRVRGADAVQGIKRRLAFCSTKLSVSLFGCRGPQGTIKRINSCFKLGADQFAKIAIGQIPYCLTIEQMGNLLHDLTGCWPLALDPQEKPFNICVEGGKEESSLRRTGLWFVYIRLSDLDTFLTLHKCVVVHDRGATEFEAGASNAVNSWCLQNRGDGQYGRPKSLLPMSVQATPNTQFSPAAFEAVRVANQRQDHVSFGAKRTMDPSDGVQQGTRRNPREAEDQQTPASG